MCPNAGRGIFQYILGSSHSLHELPASIECQSELQKHLQYVATDQLYLHTTDSIHLAPKAPQQEMDQP